MQVGAAAARVLLDVRFPLELPTRFENENEVDPRKSVRLVADPGAVRKSGRPTLNPGLTP